MALATTDIQTLLGESGPFCSRIEGFSPRPQQQSMALAVQQALTDMDVLVCEAGTGTGKTLAYLCPVLRSGKKTIISTGTKNLQEQLFHRDLPVARDALGLVVRAALLKGRANYLCLHRLQASEHQPSLDPVDQAEVAGVRAWSGATLTGDIAECADIPENSPVWAKVTSTVENCLGTECGFYADCHVLKARRAAIEADVVVVNHHLFFADMALREEGFGELLPGAHAVIFDEAHQLPEIATRFFGISLSSGQLRELSRDVVTAYHAEAGDTPELLDSARAIEKAAGDLRRVLGTEAQRIAWRAIADEPKVHARVEALAMSLTSLADQLELVAQRAKGLDGCYRRCLDLTERLDLLQVPDSDESVRWVELYPRAFVWHQSPLEIAPLFSARMQAQRSAWIFTSATLAINDSLEHFTDRLGLGDYAGRIWGSPFDFRHQSLCYVPEGLPEPRHPEHTARVVDAALPVLEASRGRAFFLFTSHAALQRAAKRLADNSSFELLVQGSAPRDELLRLFRRTPSSVLLGTSSFWEGVDVRGDALSCVIIDKLPFAAPDDPLLQARSNALREQGKDPFRHYQLPQAVLALKQGAGRLIRDENDCGVLMLCDPRLYDRPYGRLFRDSLPPMPVTRRLEDVQRFFAGSRE